MLGKFRCGYIYRTFLTSRLWRNLEKAKPLESPSTSSNPSPQRMSDMSMNFSPTEFEKKILLLSGKFKSRKEIPARIRFETMDNAKSRLRIRISNLLMVTTVVACVIVISVGKKRQKKGDSILKQQIEREDQIRAETQRSKQQ